ncbi:MAG: hypothetical protein JKY52_17530, partial [Flavobacteriales bacterium]|nr:hypothetical protein [Flavobacteriales bacterium]
MFQTKFPLLAAIVIGFLLYITMVQAQSICTDKHLKKLKKEHRRTKDINEQAKLAFNLADCYKQRDDSTYLEVMKVTISSLKGGYTFRTAKGLTIYQVALCYYKMEEYKQSTIWFSKAIKVKYRDPLRYSYRGHSFFMLGSFQEALTDFEAFKEKSGSNKKVDQLISRCRE